MSSPSEDPYTTLNVSRKATPAQIKTAYRKLALKYHPDRQNTEQEKVSSSKVFVKIGNAYEILSDKDRKKEFDTYGTVGSGGASGPSAGFGGFGGMEGMGGMGSFISDPFFSGGRGQPGFAFTDPFELFKEAFGDDQGQGGPFGGMSGMMNMMQGGMGGGGSSSFTSFSSSSMGGGGGTMESVSTRTEVVNGQRRTVTERKVQRPDGTVERTVETNGGGGELENGGGHGQMQRKNSHRDEFDDFGRGGGFGGFGGFPRGW